MKVILASASPRRQELLHYIFNDFECIPADIDETIPDGVETEFAPEYFACQKALYISKLYPDALVIGSDTVVIVGSQILGKPSDENDARNMLRLLSGTTHSVVTGCCLFLNGKSRSFAEETFVEFNKLSDKEIDDYISTREPFDKAGAYGIQGFGSLLVRRIDGDFFNVVGLPVSRLNREIKEFVG